MNDKFNQQQFKELGSITSKYCISIFLPTHESGWRVNEGIDQIEFKNLLQEARKRISATEQGRFVDQLLKPGFDLLDDINFWHNASKGLACFITDSQFFVFRLPVDFKKQLQISDHFNLLPLTRVLSNDGKFYVLALSYKSLRFFRFTGQEIQTVKLNVPESLVEMEQEVQEMANMEGRTAPGERRTSGFSYDAGQNEMEPFVEEYFKKISGNIDQILKEEKAPLIMATVDDVYDKYKFHNMYPYLMTEHISGNPDRIGENELCKKALEIYKPFHHENFVLKNTARYSQLAGSGKTSNDVEVISRDSGFGRIDTLIIADASELYEENNQGIIDIINKTLVNTINNSGNCLLVNENDFPEKEKVTPMVAIYRY